MSSVSPPSRVMPDYQRMQEQYRAAAALAKEAMDGIVEACANLTPEARNNAIRAAVAYAEADHARRVWLDNVTQFAQKHGIR